MCIYRTVMGNVKVCFYSITHLYSLQTASGYFTCIIHWKPQVAIAHLYSLKTASGYLSKQLLCLANYEMFACLGLNFRFKILDYMGSFSFR